jgi:hypothetical protein
MASNPKPTPAPTHPLHCHTLATILKSPLTPSTLRALSILFPSTYRT